MTKSALAFSLMFVYVVVGALSGQSQPSEPRLTKQDYLAKFADQAVREMHASGVPASITLAQGILESDYGNSPLAKYAKNHFGIKCHKGWNGPTFIQDDDEKNECFRKYYDAHDSYRDHSEFLRTRDRYASLFDLKITDYKGWAHGLKKAGYATNPKYAPLLIRVIEDNELYKYDRMAKLPETEVMAWIEKPDLRPNNPNALSVRTVKVSGNKVKYIVAKFGDTPESIAKENAMRKWQISKYNELDKNHSIMVGDIIYLQPKRNHAERQTHTVEAGETLHSISQKHGVKMKRLIKMNGFSEDFVPEIGQVIILRNMSKITKILTGR